MRTLVWAESEQTDFIASVCARANLQIIAAGSPDASDGAKIALELNAEAERDFRQALRRDELDVVWLAATQALAADDRRLVRERNISVFSSEPRPGSLAEVATGAEADPSIFLPLMRRSPGFQAARDVLDAFGEPRCVSVTFRCGRGQGSLFARLFDAMDMIEALCGQAVQIDSTLSSPNAIVPDQLSGLRGHLTANLRFSENRSACIAVSDNAGRWFRGVTVLGEGGCLRIDDAGFEWIAPDASLTDRHESSTPTDACSIFVEQIRRRLDRLDASPAVIEAPTVLALCEATRLSARTGGPETPRKMLELMGRP